MDKANKYLTRRKLCVIIPTVNVIRATAKTVNPIAKSAAVNNKGLGCVTVKI